MSITKKSTVDDLINAIIAEGEAKVIGLGTFTVVDKPARTGRNPATGESIQIAASKQLKFKASATLKNEL